ncbi:hypothetical protein [Sodalis ligni]|nr:hypothetical protein [Sodalis ligni]
MSAEAKTNRALSLNNFNQFSRRKKMMLLAGLVVLSCCWCGLSTG